MTRPITLLLLSAALALGLNGCGQPKTLLDEIRQRGELRLVTRYGPTTYYINRGAPTGFEYSLARDFARFLDVRLEVQVLHSLDDIYKALYSGTADIAAAGLTADPRHPLLQFGPGYLSVKKFVVYRRGKNYAESPADLIGKRVVVMADSGHAAALREAQNEHPALRWEEQRNIETLDLLEMLEQGDIDFTVIDSNEFTANRGYYSHLRVAFALGEAGELAWAMGSGRSTTSLQARLSDFFRDYRLNGRLASLVERYYGHNESNSQVNSMTFLDNVQTRLPKYRAMIEQVALEFDIDWRLLTAVSYQESHWDPRARSPTGVRGMMMLTLPTAREMGVKNRLDPEQSLRGGARYIKKMLRRIPDSVKEPDRTWFALAAYNVGFGSLRDARTLTTMRGGNPDLWKDVKKVLPLLRQKKYYDRVQYGFARGDEAVRYVQNVRHYYSLLTWQDLTRVRQRPPPDVMDFVPAELTDPGLFPAS